MTNKELLNKIYEILEDAPEYASQEAKKYSDDHTSQMAYETGVLRGINSYVQTIIRYAMESK